MNNQGQNSGFKMRYIWVAAAAVFIAVGLWWTMGKSGNLSATQLTDKYIAEQFANPTASTRESAQNPLWQAAMQAYTKHDFAAAAKNIAGIEAPDDEQIFYKSLALMYQNPPDFDNSSAGFVQLMRKNINFKDESQWFYILISLKKGEKEAAISMLENVIGKQNMYAEKAATLLKKLK
jgi:hypothetical protein